MENEYLWGVWFYRVTEIVTAFNEKNELIQDYEYIQDFTDSDWPTQRKAAIEYYEKRGANLPEKFIYSYLSPEEHRENPGIPYATYSAIISFVFWKSEDDFEENFVAGKGKDSNAEGMEIESRVWEEHGLQPPVKLKSL